VPNFVQQETLQHHRRNKSWSCALIIRKHAPIQCQHYTVSESI
jgi:hypothetical protein